MTNLFIKLYQFFNTHKAVWLLSMVALLGFFGYYSTKIYLEEDIARLLPSSRNEDGSIKLAFSSLRIKDKSFIVFQDKEGMGPEALCEVIDAFCDTLQAQDNALPEEKRTIGNLFYQVPTEDLMYEAVDYMKEHMPNYIDTSCYAGFDTLLTEEHVLKQLLENREDATSLIGEAFPELLQMDPIGMRYVLLDQMGGLMSSAGGSYSVVNDHLFVPDSTVAIAIITPRFAGTDSGNGAILFEWMNDDIEAFAAAHPGVKIGYYGAPANGAYNSWTLKKDIFNNILWSLIIVLVIIFICFRNYNTIPLLLLPVGFGTVFGLSMMYFIKGQFSLLALGIGAIVLGVALSYVLHVLTHYKYVSDPEQVLKDQVKPVFLGCLTTIGSFMGLIFINTELLQDFGLFAAFAIVGTTAFSLLYLPQFFNPEKNKINRHAFALIDRINAYPFDRKTPFVIIILLVVAVCLGFYFVGGTNFDADMRNLGYNSDNVVYSEDIYREKTYNGYKQVYFASSGDTMEEALDNFEALAEKLDSLKKEGLVRSYTPTNKLFVPEKIQQERIDAWKNYWTDEKVALVDELVTKACDNKELRDVYIQYFNEIAQYDYEPAHLYEMEFIPQGLVSTMMEENVGGCLVFTSIECEVDTVRSDSTDYHRICDAIATQPNLLVLDTYYYTQDTLTQLNEDFNILQWVSMLFVFAVLLVSFKFNIKHTLLGLMPIILSWLIVLGAMVIFDVRFNLINIIISTFIFGIGVDYSIFVMNGLVDGQYESKRINTLLQYHKTAILLSAMVLIVTVASMCFALHPAIKSVGFATVVGMIAAVVIAYVVQPFLFRLMNKKSNQE